jgi:hypothetical protein
VPSPSADVLAKETPFPVIATLSRPRFARFWPVSVSVNGKPCVATGVGETPVTIGPPAGLTVKSTATVPPGRRQRDDPFAGRGRGVDRELQRHGRVGGGRHVDGESGLAEDARRRAAETSARDGGRDGRSDDARGGRDAACRRRAAGPRDVEPRRGERREGEGDENREACPHGAPYSGAIVPVSTSKELRPSLE